MSTATVNGQQLGYDDSGGNGPVVVFSHGFFMDRTMFAPQVAELAGPYRCITVDARGFGETSSDGQPFTYWDSADDLAGLLDHLGIARATFVGMSQGGFTTLRLAIAHPDRVAAIVLIDTDAEFYDDATQTAYRQGKDALLADGWSDGYAAAMGGILFGPSYDSSEWQARWQRNDVARMGEPFEAMITRDDIKGLLGSITCPALVLHGQLDASIPLASAEFVCESLPNCVGVTIIEGSGHSSNLENPAATNRALRTFLAVAAA